MLLTNKALDDFKECYNMSNFNELQQILQCALILEFFDSVGIFIDVRKSVSNYWIYYIFSNNHYDDINISALEPMQESRLDSLKKAIIKADEIYNARFVI